MPDRLYFFEVPKGMLLCGIIVRVLIIAPNVHWFFLILQKSQLNHPIKRDKNQTSRKPKDIKKPA